MPYKSDRYWSDMVMQPIAMRDYYRAMWPGCQIEELDKGVPGSLAHVLDIAGGDKLIKFQSGAVAFLGQRFRRHKYAQYDDFTIRFHRDSGMKTEFEKIVSAVRQNTLLAGYYAYGLANETDNGFERFRILNFHQFMEASTRGLLPEPDIIPNGDGTSFASWPFKRLRNYIVREWTTQPVLL